ncbi:MAG TPA: hypothetical protein VGR47_09915 [Terracidiphilus sp.]|nr:hypothetical protein [Terracidiphilus sp.]
MRILLASSILLVAALPASAGDHLPPAVHPAQSYAAVEVHAQEQVAIAAEPYDTKEKESLFRVDYLKHGFMPVLLTITNLGDHPISLNDARILFETASGDTVQAAEPEDVQRTMTRAQRQGRNIPIPAPLPGIHVKTKGNYQAIQDDFNTFEYKALVVDPHSTQAGFLFYDVAGLAHPLQGAHLYVREVRNADGKELFSFEVPFDKYLQSKSSRMH